MSSPAASKKAKVDVMDSKNYDFHDPTILHDQVLLVGGQKFYVQVNLLSICSEHFRTLFYTDFKEKDKKEIELKDVSADEFNVFLQVIYPGFFEVEASHIESLIDLSNRFLVPKVMEICNQFIEKNFDQMDKMMLFEVASKHNIETLKLYQKIYNFLFKPSHFRKKSLDFICEKVDSLNFVCLLDLAFEHNVDQLKKCLRAFIYTAKREPKGSRCKQCPDGMQRQYCTHIARSSSPITRNALIAKHIDEIMKLPAEIQSFVLLCTVRFK